MRSQPHEHREMRRIPVAKASDFTAMNEAYAAFFGNTRPARTTVQAALVEEGMKVEIDCVAFLPPK